MLTTRTWKPSQHSLLKLEQNSEGKYALYVGGRATGFHDIETIFTALDIFQASDEALRIVQAMRNEMTHRQEELARDVYDLWCKLIADEEGDTNNE
jgi:hypothetical protein